MKIVRVIVQIVLGLLVALVLLGTYTYRTADSWKINVGFVAFCMFLIMLLGPWWPSSDKREESRLDLHSDNSKAAAAQQNGEQILPSTVDQRLRICMYAALVIMAAISAYGIPWSSLEWWAGLTLWAVAVTITSLPYLNLRELLARSTQFPRFQTIAIVVAVVPPLAIYLAFHFVGPTPTATSGWEYILVPGLQMGLQELLSMALKLVEAYEARKSFSQIQ